MLFWQPGGTPCQIYIAQAVSFISAPARPPLKYEVWSLMYYQPKPGRLSHWHQLKSHICPVMSFEPQEPKFCPSVYRNLKMFSYEYPRVLQFHQPSL